MKFTFILVKGSEFTKFIVCSCGYKEEDNSMSM